MPAKKKKVVRKDQASKAAKNPRKDGGFKSVHDYAPLGNVVDKVVQKHVPRLGGIPVNYCYTFHTSWTGDLSRYTQDVPRWERERMLYNILLMDGKRFQIHTQKSNSIRIKNTIKGETVSITVLQQVYLEFTDTQRTVPVEDLIHYTDPLLLLGELGVK